MENGTRGFLDAVRRSMRQVREVVGAASIDPALLTAAERIQYEGYLRREEADAAICALAEAGVPIRRICQRLGHSRKVVRAVLRGERTDVFRVRQSSLDAYLPWLDAQWDAGSRNATELWRRAKGQGCRGSLRVVGEWATRRRRAEQAKIERLQRVPSARTLARWLTMGRDRLTKAEPGSGRVASRPWRGGRGRGRPRPRRLPPGTRGRRCRPGWSRSCRASARGPACHPPSCPLRELNDNVMNGWDGRKAEGLLTGGEPIVIFDED